MISSLGSDRHLAGDYDVFPDETIRFVPVILITAECAPGDSENS